MSVPLPESSLSGHCAAIDRDTLYVLDNDGGLQSLPLKKNATWTEETKTDYKVKAPACVKDDADGALYVIGGGSDDGTFMGVQRYLFNDKRWEAITPLADVLQNRMNHSIAYLEDSQSILIYAGAPEDQPADLSSQTFLLSTQYPYDIQGYLSYAPPANNPILQPWNSSHAVLVGGQTLRNEIWLFGPSEGWTNLSILQVFDMHTSPNTAQGIVLLGEGGRPAHTGETVGAASSSNPQKRDLSISSWPTYNSTNAPTSTREDCSIARNSDGVIVMAGGNDNDPLIMYDQSENSWIDANKFFSSKQQQPLQASSTSKPSATATPTESATPSSTTAAASAGGPSAHDKMMRTLGITLGVLCGIAALFILVLLFLRWRKMKAKKRDGYLQEKDGAGEDGAGRLSFADRGASFMKEAGLSSHELAPPPRQDRFDRNNGSHSSLAIMTNKWGNGGSRTRGQEPKASFESTAQLVKDKHGNFVPTENHEMMDIGDKVPVPKSNLPVPGGVASSTALDKDTRIERKRSSGWSKYFATSQPTGPNGLSHLPAAYAKPKTLSAQSMTSDAASEYSQDERRPSQMSTIPSSALVPPLDIDFSKTVDGQRLSHVARGSPRFMDSREDLSRTGSAGQQSSAQKGQIVDPRSSQATSVGSFDNRSTLSSNLTSDLYNESAQTAWTPMSGDIVNRGRATSSVYTNSVHDPGLRVPSRGKSAGFFPGAGTTYKPSKVKLSHAAGPTSEWASPKAQQTEWALPPKAPALTNKPAELDRSSTVTVFPGMDYLTAKGNEQVAPGAQSSEQQHPNPGNTDMSWLNLGLNKTPTPQ
ncbi:uncharacterized protein MYCFIDRAFT_89938 [Pseudocercospora fijiensis CIRAD86]|uniref:Uncharacterized protein n=1 Tax=Pseudocercospora fijiensis (strain CIRAD86) TaxID=383855 RepID=N1QA36_PSEFD|nr:uncharacterized protein MYCFIDRAFT_89938 [Pseudocercospora fijiensis CIRAD86]EME89724.1 hypothetical protein MYCFIDRAFT_89938 [Pseudocercospora fijiensis CIRAD86]